MCTTRTLDWLVLTAIWMMTLAPRRPHRFHYDPFSFHLWPFTFDLSQCWVAAVLCTCDKHLSVLSSSIAKTSPQSNLRRARRSSADKTSTRIANYWDRTALACCRHSKRVEPSRKIWLDSARRTCVVCVYVCCAAAKMIASHSSAATARSPCCICFVTFLHMNFSSTPTSILNLTIS